MNDSREPTKLTRRQRERERHRLEVLDAAESLLERRVYHEISIQEIAAEAEFSVGYLYRLFANKEEIYTSLIARRFAELERLLDQQCARKVPVEERIAAVVRAVSNWFKNNSAFAANYLGAVLVLARTREAIAADLTRHEAAVRQKLDTLFQEAMDQGVLERGDPSLVTATLRALLWGFVAQNLLSWLNPAKCKKEKWIDYAPLIVRVVVSAFGCPGGQPRRGQEISPA